MDLISCAETLSAHCRFSAILPLHWGRTPQRGHAMDVFEAVNSRIAARWFLDKPVDHTIVRQLLEGAARAASSGNVQPWNVYAVTGAPLKEITRQATEAIAQQDWRTMATEYQDMPEPLWEPYRSRNVRMGRNSMERSARPVRIASDGTNRSNAITSSSMRRWVSSSPSTAGSAPAS